MKACILSVSTALMIIFLAFPGTPAFAQTGSLRVTEAEICRDVAHHACLEAGNIFKSSVGKLYCLTTIKGAGAPTEVAHVWYFDGKEQARIKLNVRSPIWRTYSAKEIRPSQAGDWRVDVKGPAGETLKTLDFKVIP